MSQELVIREAQQPIVMKGGLVHWVSEETAERFQQQLQTQTSHTFVRLKEINITINTAEVEGVYTMAQYEDLCKVKEGMWQCVYRNWHNKGKKECECKKDYYRKQEEDRKRREEADSNRPLTEEERQANLARIHEISEHFRTTGLLPRKMPAPVAAKAPEDDGIDFTS